MTIAFEKLKVRLLTNPRVKAEYDVLAPEFEIDVKLLRARRGRTKSTPSCERSEAIQTYDANRKLDCFVASLLAMTVWGS